MTPADALIMRLRQIRDSTFRDAVTLRAMVADAIASYQAALDADEPRYTLTDAGRAHLEGNK